MDYNISLELVEEIRKLNANLKVQNEELKEIRQELNTIRNNM